MFRVTAPLLFALFALMPLVGCSHEPAPGESIAAVCVVDNSGQTVTTSGYLKAAGGTTYCDRDGCPFYLGSTYEPTPKGEPVVRISLHRGTAPRQVEILKNTNYGAKDVIFRDDAGTPFHAGDVARVTGAVDVRAVGDAITCTMRRPTAVQAL